MAEVILKLEDLKFDLNNPRISVSTTEEESLEKILGYKKGDMYSLCQEIIAQKGFLESPLIDCNNVVYDGNRRLTAIKILKNPALIPDQTFKHKIQKLHNAHTALIDNIAKKIKCQQEVDNTRIKAIVDSRHAPTSDGLRSIAWGAVEKARRQDPNSHTLEVYDFATSNGLEIIGDGYSTLDRIVKSKYFKDNFLVLFTAGNTVEFLKGLKKIYSKINDESFNTRTLHSVKNISDALSSLLNISTATAGGTFTTNPNQSAKPNVSSPSATPSPQPVKTKSTAGKQKTAERDFLIDKYNNLPDVKKHVKLNDIIVEIRKLKVCNFQIAVSFLFRTLIELSVDLYIANQKISITKDDQLRNKLLKAIDHIKANGGYESIIPAKDLLVLRDAFQNNKAAVSIMDLNSFVHSLTLPDEKSLKTQYTNIEPLLVILLS